jgi:hypothetical protein
MEVVFSSVDAESKWHLSALSHPERLGNVWTNFYVDEFSLFLTKELPFNRRVRSAVTRLMHTVEMWPTARRNMVEIAAMGLCRASLEKFE